MINNIIQTEYDPKYYPNSNIEYNLLAKHMIMNIIGISSIITKENMVEFSFWFNDILYYMTTFTVNINFLNDGKNSVQVYGTLMNNKVNAFISNIWPFKVYGHQYHENGEGLEVEFTKPMDTNFAYDVKQIILKKVSIIIKLYHNKIILFPWEHI